MTRPDLKTLAKTELHCHLDGSLSLSAIRQLADLAGIAIPDQDADLKKLVTAPDHVTSLNDYLETFAFVRPLLQTEEALSLAAYDVARQAAQEGVIYTEIRFAPELSMDQGLTAGQVVAAVVAGLKKAEQDLGIVAKGLICGMRQSDQDQTRQIFAASKPYLGQGIVGGDFAGNEVDYPTQDLADLITELSASGFPMTFHAGECGCPSNIAQAIALGIKRIGHGTAVYKQPDLIAEMVAQGVTAEICLTSNLQTKAVEQLADFPYPALKAAGASISINTDNRTVSDTNLTKEYQLYQEHFGTSPADFYQHNQDAIRASFASPEEKNQLLERLSEAYAPYLDK